MITINGYTPKDIQPFPSSSDQAKILDARNFLISFLAEKINDCNEILDYKIKYTVDRGIALKIIRKSVTFNGGARRIQEECRRFVENSVDDALRFSELLMRCAIYCPTRELELTISEEIELNDYLEIFALRNHKIQKIVLSFDLEL